MTLDRYSSIGKKLERNIFTLMKADNNFKVNQLDLIYFHAVKELIEFMNVKNVVFVKNDMNVAVVPEDRKLKFSEL